MKVQKFTVVILVVLGVLLIAGLIAPKFLGSTTGADKKQLAELGFYRFDSPRNIAPVVLKDLKGEKVTLIGRHEQWQLVNFGYMFCPDICPVNLRFISDIKKAWDAENSQNPFAITHITFDPERDTADRLEKYLDYHNTSYDGLTGDLENIRKVAQQLNTVFIHEKPDEYGNYFITHSDSIALINPKGQYVGMFKGPYDNYNIDSVVEVLSSVIN
ncbi:MAG: SCO family protein [Cellvibrionaceae bacterium]